MEITDCVETTNRSAPKQLRSPSLFTLCQGTVEIPQGQSTPFDNLDPYVARALEIFLNCVVINLISIFGIVGNSINIAVLRQHGFQESTNIILISLSISDLIFCFMCPVTRLRCLFSHFDVALSLSVHTFVTVVLFMPKYVCLATSFGYVAFISLERFVAVYFPFHVSKIFTKCVTKFLVITMPTVAVVSLFPTFFALTAEWEFDPTYNRSIAIMQYTTFYLENEEIIAEYTWVGLNNFFCASSISIVTLCCLAIGFKLMRAAVKREQMTSRSTGYDVKVVKMLITVCIVYLIVAIPTITLYSYFKPSFIFESVAYELVDNICVTLYNINASVNFLVYVSMSKKFATTYKKLLSCQSEPKKKISSRSL